MKPKDSGRKVTCKIEGTLINDGELYYCPVLETYYIFQNEKRGATPQSIKTQNKGYKYSWFYRRPSDNWLDRDVTEFQFKGESSVQRVFFQSIAETGGGSDSVNFTINFTFYDRPDMQQLRTNIANLIDNNITKL